MPLYLWITFGTVVIAAALVYIVCWKAYNKGYEAGINDRQFLDSAF